jgi:hypothetical protein
VALLTTLASLAQAQSHCDATKAKEAGKKLYCKTKVIAKADKTGAAIDQVKLVACETKFEAKCAKAVAAGGCQQGTCAALEQVVDDCVNLIRADIGIGGGISTCDGGKMKEAGKRLYCKAKIIAKAYKTGAPIDQAKLVKCETKFDATCAKAVAAGDCQQGTCGTLEQVVDNCVNAIRTNIGVGTGSTTSSTTTTTLPSACDASAFPTCGGACAPGRVCAPLENILSGQAGCSCVVGSCGLGDAGYCGGGVCPPGQKCSFGVSCRLCSAVPLICCEPPSFYCGFAASCVPQ